MLLALTAEVLLTCYCSPHHLPSRSEKSLRYGICIPKFRDFIPHMPHGPRAPFQPSPGPPVPAPEVLRDAGLPCLPPSLSCSLAGVVGWVPGSGAPPARPQPPGSPQLCLHPDTPFEGEKYVLDQPTPITDPLEQSLSLVYMQHSYFRSSWLPKIILSNT